MTPKEAARALVGAMPSWITPVQMEEYGIETSPEQAQRISREILSLNLFWIFAAIEAHIPSKYQAAVLELVFSAAEDLWATTAHPGSMTWTAYLNEWKERKCRYERLARDGASPLVISTELGMMLEDQGVVQEGDRRNLLTLLIDSVPVETYGRLLEDVG